MSMEEAWRTAFNDKVGTRVVALQKTVRELRGGGHDVGAITTRVHIPENTEDDKKLLPGRRSGQRWCKLERKTCKNTKKKRGRYS